jgi:3-phosphoshikimate 1-carboxyvinyltransferase
VRGSRSGDDFIRVVRLPGGQGLRPAAIDTYDDHRIAMCFSLAALGTPLRINDPQTVAQDLPRLFRALSPKSPRRCR